MSTLWDIMSTSGGYHDECGDTMSTSGDFSTLGDIMSTSGFLLEIERFYQLAPPHAPHMPYTLHKLHANYVLVPADKAANNVIVVCKKYYIDTLVKQQ